MSENHPFPGAGRCDWRLDVDVLARQAAAAAAGGAAQLADFAWTLVIGPDEPAYRAARCCKDITLALRSRCPPPAAPPAPPPLPRPCRLRCRARCQRFR